MESVLALIAMTHISAMTPGSLSCFERTWLAYTAAWAKHNYQPAVLTALAATVVLILAAAWLCPWYRWHLQCPQRYRHPKGRRRKRRACRRQHPRHPQRPQYRGALSARGA